MLGPRFRSPPWVRSQDGPAREPHQRAYNLETGRQLCAARVPDGLALKTLGTVLGVDRRSIRFWERKHKQETLSINARSSPHMIDWFYGSHVLIELDKDTEIVASINA